MIGSARLRSSLCEVNFTDTYDIIKTKCSMTKDDLLIVDPNERKENHLGSEIARTNTTSCKMPPIGSTRDAQVSCIFVVGILGMQSYQSHYSVLLKVQTEAHHTILKEGVPV